MYQIEIRIPFRAAHRLVGAYKGKCNNLHGEGYTAIIILEKNRLDENDMVIDFSKAKSLMKEYIDKNLDHSYIHAEDDAAAENIAMMNLKHFQLKTNPTAECLAEFLFKTFKKEYHLPVVKVGIIESFEDSIAWYYEAKK